MAESDMVVALAEKAISMAHEFLEWAKEIIARKA